jgi:hypothetical protein
MVIRTVAALLAASAVVLVPSTASAHTELVNSDPRNGARLEVAPTTLTLSFNETISPDLSTVVLSVGDKGDEQRSVLPVRQGSTPSTLIADVPLDALPAGGVGTLWVATYRVSSRDGHAVEGGWTFRAPAGDTVADPLATTSVSPAESPLAATSPEPSSPPQSVPKARDGSAATTSTATSTLVIGGLTLIGVALGCGLLIRARRRALDS